MYKALFTVSSEQIDTGRQEIFTPFINCYYLHSVTISWNGISYQEDNDFTFIGQNTKWAEESFSLDGTEHFIFDINYFYIKPDNVDVLSFLIDNTYSNESLSKEIISKHYTEGQFSLDNGLNKNAVLNFGTTLEGILNKSLTNQNLNDLINNYTGMSDKTKMHFLRNLRNKVHPNNISATQDVTRKEAIEARNFLEQILKLI